MTKKINNNLKTKLKLERDAKILLLIAGLFTIALGLSNTFVNIFIWRIKKDFISIGYFNLFIHITTPLTFILAGYLSKKKDGTIALRIGIFFHAIYFFLILVLKNDAANYLILLGSFLGISAGFYWLAFHVLSFDLTNDMNRDTFNSYNGMISSLSGMFAPITAGFIISKMLKLTGYYLIFGISFAIFIIIVVISLFLHTHKVGNDFKLLKTIKTCGKSCNAIILATLSFGIRNGVIMFLVNLLIFITLKSELSIGKISLLGAFISVFSFQIIERLMKPDRRKLFIWTGAIMMFFSVMALYLQISLITLIIFTLVNSFFAPFFNVPFNSASYNILDKTDKSNERIEFIIYKEISLNIGRIIGIIAFIVLVKNSSTFENLKYILLVIGSTQLAVPLLINYINADGKVI